MRQDDRKITIPKDQEKYAAEELIRYFERERKEELGNMEALMLLSFMLEKVGPYIYNQAVMDSLEFMTNKVEDLYGLMM